MSSSVGIFMPAFNTGKYIEKSILSIKNQTFKEWELVILDDGSTDNTHEEAARYYNNKIHVFKRDGHCGKIGQVKNEAISKFHDCHEYICHVGSDDLIPPYVLKTFVDFMNNNKDVGACYGNFLCFNDEGKTWSLPHVANSGEYDPSILLKFNTFFPLRFYRKEIIEKIGGYSSDLTSAVDYDLALKIDEVTKVKRLKNPISYYYRQHEQQVSTRAHKEQDLNAKTALENALIRRGMSGKVINDAPPFIIEKDESSHFIWGK